MTPVAAEAYVPPWPRCILHFQLRRRAVYAPDVSTHEDVARSVVAAYPGRRPATCDLAPFEVQDPVLLVWLGGRIWRSGSGASCICYEGRKKGSKETRKYGRSKGRRKEGRRRMAEDEVAAEEERRPTPPCDGEPPDSARLFEETGPRRPDWPGT